MKRKNQKIIYFALILFFLVTGMYFDNDRIPVCFADGSLQTAGACLEVPDDVYLSETACTIEMLSQQRATIQKPVSGQSCNQKREIRISFDVLSQDIYRAEQKNHVLDSGVLQLSEQLPKERIMNYIHKTDGKKRL
ncbi:MAG: hypothetical protein ACI4DW_00330 [Lachnospiraceae bacterium]